MLVAPLVFTPGTGTRAQLPPTIWGWRSAGESKILPLATGFGKDGCRESGGSWEVAGGDGERQHFVENSSGPRQRETEWG